MHLQSPPGPFLETIVTFVKMPVLQQGPVADPCCAGLSPRAKFRRSEKSAKGNIDLLDYCADLVRKYKQAVTVPVLEAAIGDVALYWRELADGRAFDFTNIKADAKALKSMIVCVGRLRERADRQRDPELSRVVANWLYNSIF